VARRSQIPEREQSVHRRARRAGEAAPPNARDRVLELQRTAGNAAVSAQIEQAARAPEQPVPVSGGIVQRGFFSNVWKKVKGFFGKPQKGEPIEEATSGGGTAGPETSSVAEETTGGSSSSETETEESQTDGGATDQSGAGKTEADAGPIAPETKKAEPEHPSPPPLAMDLASGEAVLKNAFGALKTIVPGAIQILAPPAFKEAYDKIYGAGQYSWDRYVVPTYGSLNGFAHGGVNYINTGSAGLHTVVHEMLHNNCANDFIPVVGSRFNEGATEILTQVACAKLSVDAPVCYPGESPCVQALLDAGLPLADLEAAYLNGGAKEKIADWADANCKESWAAIKGHMEAKDWAAAKAGMAKK
jgi:hypothetical protein